MSKWFSKSPKRFYSTTTRHRVCLRDPKAAAQVAEAFFPAGTKDKVVIEAFPGFGVLTQALLELPRERIRKIIVLEHVDSFLDKLQPLGRIDPRVQILPLDGYAWSTYRSLEDEGHLRDVEPRGWREPNPSLQFIGHIPTSIFGEQLVAQLLRLIPDQGWLFRFGRVPMSYLMHDFVWERLSAEPSALNKNRCKLSVIAQAVASFREAIPSSALQPYEDHFWPPTIAAPSGRSKKNRQNRDMVAVTIDPLVEQIIEKSLLDKWDYCLRKLFVLKSTPLERAISHLAPGASALVDVLAEGYRSGQHSLNTSKPVREMDVNDWAVVVKTFDSWPFAPEELLITDSFAREGRH